MAWNEGVQQRVSTTSSMLAQIKQIKMMGLTDYFAAMVHKLRVSELDMSKKFRLFIVRIILICESRRPSCLIMSWETRAHN